ncbi:MAG: hypothetical protein IBV53_07935 [Candidatus Atribacteria bacterium]
MYKHTQIGYLFDIVLSISLLILLFIEVVYEFTPIVLALFIFLLLSLVLFPSLTIEIDKTKLIIRFGLGIISRNFNLENIRSCRVAKNPWYYGWRISLTPHGWLYNISGLSSVEILMKNGKRYRLGTDEPERLEYAIKQTIKEFS